MHKLVEQFDFDWSGHHEKTGKAEMSEEKASLLFILDTLNKHLIEIDNHPVRKTREILDEFAKEILAAEGERLEKVLFRFRQFIGSYRIDEVAYVQKTFDDFRGIIWDFIDQLSVELHDIPEGENEIRTSFEHLREAVEANSIDVLKTEARHFIDSYIEFQTKRDVSRNERIENIRRNLTKVTKRLAEANRVMAVDHLTGAYNRKSFDEHVRQMWTQFQLERQAVTLVMLDIDHFKRINDAFGHAIGDFALKECVRVLKDVFSRDTDFVARVGGEEFAVILPNYTLDLAVKKAQVALERFRNEWYVHGDIKFQFTISIGIAGLCPGEQMGAWIERSDMALYKSKNTGRNKITLSELPELREDVA